MTDKSLPSSRESEEALLGCVISLGNGGYDRVASWIRNSKAFYYSDNRKIWDAMTEMHRAGENIDVVTLVSKCRELYDTNDNFGDFGYYITGLHDDIPTISHMNEYARIVWEKFVQREVASSAYNVYRMSFSDYNKTTSVLDKHGRLLDELREIQPTKLQAISTIIEETAETLKSGANIIPFGIPVLDAPAGGMTRKEVTVLGGRPGHGKSTLMLNIVKSLCEQGYKIILFNREMSNVEMLKKLLVIESDTLTYDNVRKHNLTVKNLAEIESVKEKIKEKYSNLMMFDGIRDLNESIKEVMKHRPDVVVDDYIQLARVHSKEQRRFEIEAIMYDYKWACKSVDCSALLLSQLNREIEKRDNPIPKMSDYSESGVIEQTAETALFVFYGYNVDRIEYNENECMIVAAKSRYGQIGQYTIGFNGNKCIFYDIGDKSEGGW